MEWFDEEEHADSTIGERRRFPRRFRLFSWPTQATVLYLMAQRLACRRRHTLPYVVREESAVLDRGALRPLGARHDVVHSRMHQAHVL